MIKASIKSLERLEGRLDHGEDSAVSRTVKVGIGALALAVVAGIAVAVVVVLGAGDGEPAASASPSPSVEAPRRRIIAPDSVAGRVRSYDPRLRNIDEQLIAALKRTVPGLTTVDSQHYGDAKARTLVTFGAAAGPVKDPAATLDEWFDGAFKLSGVAPTDPGPLGGVAKCGQGTTSGLTVHACGWAHEESLGFVYFYEANPGDVPATFIQIRNEVEQLT
ncbi:hypothetical protein WEI85_06815 [Actinomycetes bacterium KLBMP 9797]